MFMYVNCSINFFGGEGKSIFSQSVFLPVRSLIYERSMRTRHVMLNNLDVEMIMSPHHAPCSQIFRNKLLLIATAFITSWTSISEPMCITYINNWWDNYILYLNADEEVKNLYCTIQPKVCEPLIITPMCGFASTCSHKIVSTQSFMTLLYSVEL